MHVNLVFTVNCTKCEDSGWGWGWGGQYHIRRIIGRCRKESKVRDDVESFPIPQKFVEFLDSTAAPSKYESDATILTPNLAGSRLC